MLERERQDALRAYEALDPHHPARPAIRALVALAARAGGVSMATINLLTDDEQHQIESVGFTGGVSARSDSMCAVVVDETAPVVLEDARSDPRFRDNPWVTDPSGVRFYATFQLRTPAKVAIGSLCIYDSEPRRIDQSQQDALTLLATHVMDVLELELSRRMLHASNRRLADFAATVSHELRGPLTTVQFALDMARESGVPSDAVLDGSVIELLDRARRATARMTDTVEHLLDTSQRLTTAAESTARDLQPVSWNTLVAATVEDLGPELDGLHLEITHADVRLLANATGLRLALQNLLTNAARYAGPVDPRVRVHVTTGEGGSTISVVDHGPGITPADRTRIFTARNRGTGTETTAGTGLGLATSRQMIEHMGGTLEAHETPGGGATFVITLPAAPRALVGGS